MLVLFDGVLLVEIVDELRTFCVSYGLLCGSSKGVSKFLVQVEGDYGLRQVIEIPAQDVCGIVNVVAFPV